MVSELHRVGLLDQNLIGKIYDILKCLNWCQSHGSLLSFFSIPGKRAGCDVSGEGEYGRGWMDWGGLDVVVGGGRGDSLFTESSYLQTCWHKVKKTLIFSTFCHIQSNLKKVMVKFHINPTIILVLFLSLG